MKISETFTKEELEWLFYVARETQATQVIIDGKRFKLPVDKTNNQ